MKSVRHATKKGCTTTSSLDIIKDFLSQNGIKPENIASIEKAREALLLFRDSHPGCAAEDFHSLSLILMRPTLAGFIDRQPSLKEFSEFSHRSMDPRELLDHILRAAEGIRLPDEIRNEMSDIKGFFSEKSLESVFRHRKGSAASPASKAVEKAFDDRPNRPRMTRFHPNFSRA